MTDINIRFDWKTTRKLTIEVPEGFVIRGLDRGHVEKLADGTVDFAFAFNAIPDEEAASYDNLRIVTTEKDNGRQH